MMNILISLLAFALTIFMVVVTHEFGHFIMARAFGIKVLRFSIGFGKALYRCRDQSGTEYVLAMIPLGGYVQMEEEGQYAYAKQALYKRVLVILAGPITNFICAILLYWLIFMVGFTAIRPISGAITPNSIAAKAELKPHQEIISIDNKKIQTWTSVLFSLISHVGDNNPLQIKVKTIPTSCFSVITQCNLDKLPLETHTLLLKGWQFNPLRPDLLGSLGIEPYFANHQSFLLLKHIQYPPLAALKASLENTWRFLQINYIVLGKMVSGKMSLQGLGGPIMIFQDAGLALHNGILPFIAFIALISLSIGFINLIPIPGLDGGHLLILSLEWMLRRPLPPRVVEWIYRAGIFVLIYLFLQVLANDVLRML